MCGKILRISPIVRVAAEDAVKSIRTELNNNYVDPDDMLLAYMYDPQKACVMYALQHLLGAPDGVDPDDLRDTLARALKDAKAEPYPPDIIFGISQVSEKYC